MARAAISFCGMPPIGPTVPSAVISPVPAMNLPPVSDGAPSLSRMPRLNIRPALGPPTSARVMSTLKGRSTAASTGEMPITGRLASSAAAPVVMTVVAAAPLRS